MGIKYKNMSAIVVKIDVSKLDKTKFFKGEKGLYAEIVLIPTPEGKYGDYMVKQNQSKEEREKKVNTPILGNGKISRGKPQEKEESDETPF